MKVMSYNTYTMVFLRMSTYVDTNIHYRSWFMIGIHSPHTTQYPRKLIFHDRSFESSWRARELQIRSCVGLMWPHSSLIRHLHWSGIWQGFLSIADTEKTKWYDEIRLGIRNININITILGWIVRTIVWEGLWWSWLHSTYHSICRCPN